MKKYVYIILFCTSLSFSQKNFFDIVEENVNYFESEEDKLKANSSIYKTNGNLEGNTEAKALAKQEKKFYRWYSFWKDRVDVNGNFDAYSKEMFNLTSANNTKKANLINAKISSTSQNTNINWGKIPGSGAIIDDLKYAHGNSYHAKGIGMCTALWVDPNDPDHVFAGMNNGGIYERTSINGQYSWVDIGLSLESPILSVSQLKVVGDYLYVSSGTIFYVGSLSFSSLYDFHGLGVLKYNMITKTWSNVSLNESVMSFDVSGDTIIANSTKEVFKSTDGGATWNNLANANAIIPDLNIPNDPRVNHYFSEVIINPLDSSNYYLATSTHRTLVANNDNSSIDYEGFLFESNDGGATWVSIGDEINNAYSSISELISDDNVFSKKWKTVTCLDGQDLFIVMSDGPVKYGGSNKNYFFKKDLLTGSCVFLGSQYTADRAYSIKVSGEHLYVGGVRLRYYKLSSNRDSILSTGYLSDYSGTRYHVDIRGMDIYNSSTQNYLYMGTDGGVTSLDLMPTNGAINSTVTSNNLNGDLNNFSAYSMSYVHNKTQRSVTIGTHDTGYYRNFLGVNESQVGWFPLGMSHEGSIESSAGDHNNFVFNATFSDLYYSTNGKNFNEASLLDNYSTTGNNATFEFDTPYSQIDGRDMVLTRTKFDLININFENKDASGKPEFVKLIDWSDIGWNVINNIKYEPSNHNIYLCMVSNYRKITELQLLILLNPDLRSDTETTPYPANKKKVITEFKNVNGVDLLPQIYDLDGVKAIGKINHVEAHNDKIWIAFGSLMSGLKILYSDDLGDTWTNVSYDLPNIPVNDIEYNNYDDEVYLATDYGVYYLDNNSWKTLGNSPKAIVNKLHYDYSEGELFAGTFGKGVWYTKMDCEEINIAQDDYWINENVSNCGDINVSSKLTIDDTNIEYGGEFNILNNGELVMENTLDPLGASENKTINIYGGSITLKKETRLTQSINILASDIPTAHTDLSNLRYAAPSIDLNNFIDDNIESSDDLEEIKIYPNPSNGQVNVLLSNVNETMKYEIFSINGDRLSAGEIQEFQTKLDLSELKGGIYLLQFVNLKGEKISKKIIIK